MRIKIGIVCMCLGTVLLLSALILFTSNFFEAKRAEDSINEILPQMMQYIDAGEQSPATIRDPYSTEMEIMEIDGFSYIGFLSIPTLDLDLPVMSEWDYDRMKIAPCRYSGSVKIDDLVIAAHNYTMHFGRLDRLTIGDEIHFTDIRGVVTLYKVYEIETLSSVDVERMISGDFDLTLFTCTYSGQDRITVRCERLS